MLYVPQIPCRHPPRRYVVIPEIIRAINFVMCPIIILMVLLGPKRGLGTDLIRYSLAMWCVAAAYGSLSLFHSPNVIRPLLTMISLLFSLVGVWIARTERKRRDSGLQARFQEDRGSPGPLRDQRLSDRV